MEVSSKDKVVIITGASSGLGRATANLFAREGAKLVLASKTKEKIEKISKEISEKHGAEVIAVPTDIRKEEECNNLAKQTIDKFGRIDILINNAGIAKLANVEGYSKEEIENILNTNYLGSVYCIRAVLPYMKQQKDGRIINISSITQIGLPGETAYSGSKGALYSYCQSLKKELIEFNIHVDILSPGGMDTEMWDEFRKQGKDLSHLLDPKEIAEWVLFIASRPGSETIENIIIYNTSGYVKRFRKYRRRNK